MICNTPLNCLSKTWTVYQLHSIFRSSMNCLPTTGLVRMLAAPIWAVGVCEMVIVPLSICSFNQKCRMLICFVFIEVDFPFSNNVMVDILSCFTSTGSDGYPWPSRKFLVRIPLTLVFGKPALPKPQAYGNIDPKVWKAATPEERRAVMDHNNALRAEVNKIPQKKNTWDSGPIRSVEQWEEILPGYSTPQSLR